MSLNSSSSDASKTSLSLSLSPRPDRKVMLTATTSNPFQPLSATTPFGSRRGNMKFSSGRFSRPPSRAKRGSLLSSFKSTRRSAARPTRTKGVFESLIGGLTSGIEAVKVCCSEMRSKISEDSHAHGTRMNYYMDLEKQTKALERKVRTLEVHKDRIEEMKDEYTLKLKLREGAFNLAQALSSQPSKAAKEKLQEARAEQRELLEDLCDIEDELETKLGVFKVHINGLIGIGRVGSGDILETQLKLGAQKWKAKCKISRHQQVWMDEDIVFLGKIMDELFLKVVEVKKIQGNVHVGSMRCLTREFFSFFPLNVTFNLPNSHVKLNMDINWSPTIGEDFLSELDLTPVPCIVGGPHSKPASRTPSNVERVKVSSPSSSSSSSSALTASGTGSSMISGSGGGRGVQQIRIITETQGESEDTESRSSNSYGRNEIKTEKVTKRSKKKKKKNGDDSSDFVFLDRQSLAINTDELKQFPAAKQMLERDSIDRESDRDTMEKTDLSSQSEVSQPCSSSVQSGKDSYTSGSLGSSNSSGSGGKRENFSLRRRVPEAVSLLGVLEAVLAALEEPKDMYPELHGLECQLSRLDTALKGGKLVKAPSMTFSESQAMGSFDFLGGDDAELMPRFSRASFADLPEDYLAKMHSRNSSAMSEVGVARGVASGVGFHQSSVDSTHSEVGVARGVASGAGFHQSSVDSASDELLSGSEVGGNLAGNGSVSTTGLVAVDKALTQHLIHCECLLQRLQSAGPLKYRLGGGLYKLQQEAQVVSELLNIAADPDHEEQKIEHILPELAASDGLMKFWKSVAKDDIFSVSFERFAVALDQQFGQALWNEFPEIANKVFSDLLNRVLDLESEDCDPLDTQMVVTVFQYSAYFIPQGSDILKCIGEVAQEMKVIEGLQSSEEDAKQRVAALLAECGYNKGALLAATHLLACSNTALQKSARKYLRNFTGNSPFYSKVVHFYAELLEHSDQTVRSGACAALGHLKAYSMVPQLKYLSKKDFSLVKSAASRALEAMGESEGQEREPGVRQSNSRDLLTQDSERTPPLQRTRSADELLTTSSSSSHHD